MDRPRALHGSLLHSLVIRVRVSVLSEEDHLQAAAKALSACDAEAIARLYADDAVFEDVPSGTSYRGREAIRTMFVALFAPPTRFRVAAVRVGRGWGVLEWVWSGRTRDSGRPFKVRGVSVLEIAASRVTKESIYYDPTPARA